MTTPTLQKDCLSININPQTFGFSNTGEIVTDSLTSDDFAQQTFGWIGQEQAKMAAEFGLGMQPSGFHLVVVGEAGAGKTSLMLQVMQHAAKKRAIPHDVLILNALEAAESPLLLQTIAGHGLQIKVRLDSLVQAILKEFVIQASEDKPPESQGLESPNLETLNKNKVSDWLNAQLRDMPLFQFANTQSETSWQRFINNLKQDFLKHLSLFQQQDNEGAIDSLLSRYRANLLVNNQGLQHAPLLVDDDPSMESLFGTVESSSENSTGSDLLKIRSGKILQANGGFLLLHLRDLLGDTQNGEQIVERLHRFLRNGHVQIKDASGAQNHATASSVELLGIKSDVKLVLIASHEEYYEMQDALPDLVAYFRIKVDFATEMPANQQTYQALATWLARQVEKNQLLHFTQAAFAELLWFQHRVIEHQNKLSTALGEMKQWVLESASIAQMRGASLVEAQDVQRAASMRELRHHLPEQQMIDAVVNGEVLITTIGAEIGQVNALTHIDMGDVGFGAAVRISARCYAGHEGVVNIDREVAMSGPQHDKGLLILQSWLKATFAMLSPLSLNATLVFEQEYYGVEGDSASCAELFALLSSLAKIPLKQGIAITGALNQHGQVMPIGGVNEKIEGYFKLCQKIGLTGEQGVIIPTRNRANLLLHADVLAAVEAQQFHIYTMNDVLDGLELLTGLKAGEIDEHHDYHESTLLGKAQRALQDMLNLRRKHQVYQWNE